LSSASSSITMLFTPASRWRDARQVAVRAVLAGALAGSALLSEPMNFAQEKMGGREAWGRR
jgi:hypothetical protein